MQRLGKNHGGYHGERIDIHHVCHAGVRAARQHGWQVASIPFSAHGELLTFQRLAPRARRNLYVSAGIHGDEPAGPLAVQRLMEENRWPDDANLFLCPCLNPTGFPEGRRENLHGKDLNRDYRHHETAEVRAHIAWLETLPRFDLTLCLHEDWEANGFYLYEVNPDGLPSLAEKVIKAVEPLCPIDQSETIDGRPAASGIIRPDLDPAKRPQWPEAFFLLQTRTRLSYTLEAPSDFPLPTRVNALVAAVNAALA
ncbi:MAG: M14 family metallocarboxypeptidase [Limisphaerales bacterium]